MVTRDKNQDKDCFFKLMCPIYFMGLFQTKCSKSRYVLFGHKYRLKTNQNMFLMKIDTREDELH